MQNSVWASADVFKWAQSIDKAKAVTATRATVAAIIFAMTGTRNH
jgi:hypothetical protein